MTSSSVYLSTTTNRNPFPGWVFFTFPRSGSVTKCDIAAEFSALGAQSLIVCRESHQDGEPHIHAVAELPPRKYTKSKVLKHFKEKYPNDYKRIDVGRIVRNSTPHAAWSYCLKEDRSPHIMGEAPTNPQVDRYNKFARDLGFRDLAALQADVKRSRATRNEQESKLLEVLAFVEEHSLDVPKRCRHVLEFFQKNYYQLSHSFISESDITFCINYPYSTLV